MVAARANMTRIVRMLHDPGSQMMDMLLSALRQGCICVVDVSRLRGTPSLILSGIILQQIFDHNQEQFTRADSETIPTIAVVEEAQAVLGQAGGSGEGPYVSWVKEGRKYDLGAVLITQQPGSINHEILSQGDNWFLFHLLSAGDLRAVKSANAHFSDDILSSLLNEPIKGHGVFWSSEAQSYPIPVRVLSFESLQQVFDPDMNHEAVVTAGSRLRDKFAQSFAETQQVLEQAKGDGKTATPMPVEANTDEEEVYDEDDGESNVDVLKTYERLAVQALEEASQVREKIESGGIPWKGVLEAIKVKLPDTIDDPNQMAYDFVPIAMDVVFGKDCWETERRPRKSDPNKTTTWIKKRSS